MKNSTINKMLRKLLLSVFIIIFCVVSGFGQIKEDSLISYIEIALRNNPVVLQKFNEYQAALQKVPQVGGLPDPELSLGMFLKPMEVLNGRQVADIKLMQMFPWFGTLKNAKDEMSLMAKAKYESFEGAKLQTSYDVQNTYYKLYKTDEDIRITAENIDILKTIERIALIQFQTASNVGMGPSTSSMSFQGAMNQNSTSDNTSGMQGMGGNQSSANVQPPSGLQNSGMGSQSGGSGLADVYRIQIEIGDLENDLELLKNKRNTLVAEFNSILNRPPEAMISITDSLSPDSLNVSLLAVSDSMLKYNPMLEMLKYEQLSLEARKKMVTQMGYPMVGLGVNYSIIDKSSMSTSEMNGKDMIMPMITVSVPLYRKKYKAMQSEAEWLKTASAQNFIATSNSLQTEYYEAIQNYEDARRRMKLYSDQALLANKTLDLIIKGFSTGKSQLSDVLRVQQQTLDYEYKQVEALTDFNTAIAWLKKLMANA